jgi:hypothetical protein
MSRRCDVCNDSLSEEYAALTVRECRPSGVLSGLQLDFCDLKCLAYWLDHRLDPS